jgi:ABC-type nitrate/sulfonate/bicarbonate transport system substrate-binding protein
MMLAAGCSSGADAPLPVEKANIVVDAFPAIDSAGLYIAQMDNLFAAQGLHVTIEPIQGDQTTQTGIDGQLNGTYDITAGDYVTYIDNELAGTAKLRIIAEAPFLQPNVLTLLVKGGSSIDSIAPLRHKVISVTQAWAAKYPNTLEAVTRALSQGQEIADTDRVPIRHSG